MVAVAPVVLAVDIASGGVSAALLDSDLSSDGLQESSWELVLDAHGVATLSPAEVWKRTRTVIRNCVSDRTCPSAIVLSSMMHTLVLVDEDGNPLGPLYTWLDLRSPDSLRAVHERLGRDYPIRCGTYFHPSFPAFKLARLALETPQVFGRTRHIASVKAYVTAQLTGHWTEDTSTASASGLLNLRTGDWDSVTLDVLGISQSLLPPMVKPTDITGALLPDIARELRLPEGLPVIAGAGDGFLANLGSGCDDSRQTAVTVGTTASVRRWVSSAAFEPSKGTFCYRYSPDRFLAGAASSNGGNALDWARQEFGPFDSEKATHKDSPLFLPFLNGERSPFWDTQKQARWVPVNAGGTPEGRCVLEGVAFQLGIYFELVSGLSGDKSETAVLSGNGFQLPGFAALVAAVIPVSVLKPSGPGLATLRGAARCGFEALGIPTNGAIAQLLKRAERVSPSAGSIVEERYDQFKTSYFE